ncbi:MAG TPA: Gfo/Idh/MocA family oxidoreductase, partial [Fimbriimonadaceae bacterium]|nr:Gfo/Idh/MocA family oxidoreductase [Fimbriimonadaceae bacterium]
MRIGVVGCGNISGIYFKNLRSFEGLEVVACADLDHAKAAAAAQEQGMIALSLDALLAREDIDLVVNLTVPKAHSTVNLAALASGKHVYCEKPLALDRESGKKTLELAKQKGLRVGCAPDTFLGGGLQTCRKLIDDGAIGEPIGANCFMLCHGHESWHPSPAFYYEKGGGPMFDMGPYYVTALVSLVGPIRSVTGMARATFPQRTITSEPLRGTVVDVDTPTHIVGTLRFENGAIGQITTSFDVWASEFPCFEVYGSEGSLIVPDPNGFGGQVWVRGAREKDWREVRLTHGYSENSRGLGVLDMVASIQAGTSHRASGELALHVLDVMQSILDAAEQGREIAIAT